MSRFAADVPEELDQMIVRLLSKDPQARATNAMVVAKQLGAMEHALSLPQTSTGRGERVDHAMPEDQGDSIANHRLDDALVARERGCERTRSTTKKIAGRRDSHGPDAGRPAGGP